MGRGLRASPKGSGSSEFLCLAPQPLLLHSLPLASHCPQSRDVHCGIYTMATSKLTSPKTLLPHYTPGIPAFSSSSPSPPCLSPGERGGGGWGNV